MARINIEDCWWVDPRRSKLIKLHGGDECQADGAAVRMWRLAQEFWGRGRKLIPLEIFETLEAAPKLIEARLADVKDDEVYIRGSSQYLDWVNSKRDAGRAGGKKSVEVRRDKHGSAQPITEADSKQIRSKRKQPEPSGSGSGSGSGSYSGSKTGERDARAHEDVGKDSSPPNVHRLTAYQSVEQLKREIPILTMEAWKARYRTPGWLEEQFDLAFTYHSADPARAPRSRGAWVQKLQTWFEIGWVKRPHGRHAIADLSQAGFDEEGS